MQVKILSVNIANPEPIATKSGQSGIFKRPQAGSVDVGKTGLAGDAIVDLANHGGEDQAVYLYSSEDYDWWEGELNQIIVPGTFGENLTLSGLESVHVCVGDRYRFGSVLLEVTSPRMPCNTLAVRMGDPHFVKRFMAANRPGIYCRVLETGALAAGETGSAERYAGEPVTLVEMFGKYPFAAITPEERRRYLSTPLHGKLASYLRGEVSKP